VSSDRRGARRLPFQARLALGSVVVFVVLLVGGAVPAFSFPVVGMSSAAATTTVQLPQRLCAAALPGESSCLAIRLVKRRVSSATATQLRKAGLARPAAVSSVASGPAGGYSPGQLAAAYGVNPATATSQTVAIVDAYQDPSVTADLDAFDAQYGLPAETSTSFKVVSQTGGSVSGITTDVGWAGEITLDVEAVRGLCHACKILLVEANSSNDDDLGAAVDEAVSLGATIVSNSYGGTEFAPDPQASDYDHPGVAILASTGDDGWYDWDGFNLGFASSNAPQVPASYSTVVGVGGTTLDLNPDGTRASETVWNDNGPIDAEGYAFANTYGITGGAAGSGCSSIYTAQTWQQNVSGYSTLGCGATLRNGVDVAADADYFTGFDTYETTGWCSGTDGNGNPCPSNPGWETIGGTSLASPLVAAMWGLAGGPAGVNYPAMTLYGHFNTAPSQLYDVTVGGTGACDNAGPKSCASFFGVPNPNTQGAGLIDCQWGASGIAVLANKYQCNAEPGYDGVSGVGTPEGVTPFQPISPSAVIQSPGALTVGVSHNFSASGSSAPFPGDSITQYEWTWGDGTTTTTAAPTASHTYATIGTETVTLTVTDSDAPLNSGRTGSESIQVSVQAPTQTLTVARSGNGSGTVSSNPSGISCGSTCSHTFATGTSVTLSATPASGSVFSGWSGACAGNGGCTVTMSQARSVTATFTLQSSAPVCLVPKVKGKTLAAAKRALTQAHCKAGKVTKKFSKVKKGHVISQRPKPGRDLAAGAKVNLVISKGKKP
jgi:PKD domain/PASTA domain/Divergent InlB B-repeat domain